MIQLQLDLSKPVKRKKNILTDSQKSKLNEKRESFIAWKLLKSNKFTDFSDIQKRLLKKYYNIDI